MNIVGKSFIPKNGEKSYDYFCTWQSQADSAKKKYGDVRDVRNALNSEFLFSEEGVLKNYFETGRENILVVLDDGWDVPYGLVPRGFQDMHPFGSLQMDGH